MKIPLFPLNTVLFPGGRINLRIFEPRYTDMVSHCMRNGIGFGICLLRDSTVESRRELFHSVGTYALITDWELLEDGLLGLHCKGEKRFTISSSCYGAGGLNEADVSWRLDQTGEIGEEEPQLLASCVDFVRSQTKAAEWAAELHNEHRLSDLNWLSYRLAELLPLTAESRQTVLDMDNPDVRLRTLSSVIQTIGRKRLD